MKAKIFSLITLLAAGAVAAQEPKKTQEPVKPAEAVSAKGAAMTEVRFSVTGLTKENVAKVKESLSTLSFQTYVCTGCKYEQSTAGKCTGCQMDLKAEKKPLIAGTMPSADDSSITLTLDQGHATRLSDIENALKKNSIGIDYTKLPIAGKAHLVIRGGTENDVPAIQKAIADAKLFEDAQAKWDASTSEIHVAVRSGATPPDRAAVSKAIEASGLKLTFADVIWGHVPGTKKT
jgi:hypothetical protein